MLFRGIRFYVAYKAMERGFKHGIVDARNTSKTCPTCCESNKLNGYVFRCRKCSLQADKHLPAAWNIAMKPLMRGALL
ncbi:MAG: zinc ribbon domain-containing protein [Thermoproteota archaeon]